MIRHAGISGGGFLEKGAQLPLGSAEFSIGSTRRSMLNEASGRHGVDLAALASGEDAAEIERRAS